MIGMQGKPTKVKSGTTECLFFLSSQTLSDFCHSTLMKVVMIKYLFEVAFFLFCDWIIIIATFKQQFMLFPSRLGHEWKKNLGSLRTGWTLSSTDSWEKQHCVWIKNLFVHHERTSKEEQAKRDQCLGKFVIGDIGQREKKHFNRKQSKQSLRNWIQGMKFPFQMKTMHFFPSNFSLDQ